ncbi:dihydroflavonol-4-reductase [Fusarium redolens]|uniref:Dihydroflavonol-4-reductase n=1 Tax=Fusarium redolens TaxID=48865 RepID=A0A9P9KBR5_FUSRE|nr:dihydroflavonol-4-reductase [Fusarium redolens]KAH7247259.1 dihydroflavonol-4-reductase [Fusarium redolens]
MSTCLVTGGTGFVGLYVIKLLLERGHKVHTTVRSLKNKSKCKPLLDLQAQCPGQLHLFEADLMKLGSFAEAMKGCQVVYHVASPFLLPDQIKDGFKDCVEPALQGTKNVLESVNETESVQRVVLTSSVSATYGDNADVLKAPNQTLTELCWNESSSVNHYPYAYSKLVAEREAWKMHDLQTRWSLVVINPGLIVGPSLTPDSVSGSLHLLEAMYLGDNRMGVADLSYPVADVREVAEAHVKAGEDTSLKGRFIVSGDRAIPLLEMAGFVRPIHKNPKALPCWNLPTLMVYAAGPFIGVSKKWSSANLSTPFKVDNTRSIRELGLKYRPIEESFQAHYKSWEQEQEQKQAKV